MKNLLLLSLLTFAVAPTFAQDETIKKLKDESGRQIKKDPADTLPDYWRKGGLYNLALAQGSLSNWAAGGDDFSLSITSYFNLFSFSKRGRHTWDNTLDLNFGYVRTTSLGGRKNDDRIDLLSKYGYGLSGKWYLSGLVNLRSQVAKGYTYPNGVRTFASTFLSPAYILTSIGVDYKPRPGFSVFLSPVTSRWVIVKNDSLSAKGLYGVAPGRTSVTEIGAFASMNYFKDFSRSIQYRGRLDLFSNYRRNPGNLDLFMTNVFAVKLSRILSASWNVDFIYDDDVKLFGKNASSPALQIKSLVGAGLAVKF